MNAQALKDRINKISKELDLPFNEVWHKLVLERFLVRLSQSDQKDYFVMKGGSLLANYIILERETKDLDLLLIT